MIWQSAGGCDILSCPSSNMGGEDEGGNAGRDETVSSG